MSRTLFCLVALILISFPNPALGQNADLWGNLKAGRYGVGFTTLWRYDTSRSAIREQQNLPPGQQVGRSMQINIWYPTVERSKRVSFADYVSLTARETDFRQTNLNAEALVEIVAKEQLDSHGISINKSGMLEYMRRPIPMRAMHGATPAPGKFPVILIGPETAFKWCVMAEFLATHGYVVAITPNSGASEKLMDFERTLFEKERFVIANETSIDDMRYMLGQVKAIKFADSSRVGVLGYSSGATIGIGLVNKGAEVKALVSLEGAIGGYVGGEVLSLTPFYSPYTVTMPILHVFTPSFGFDHYWIDQYKYSDRMIIATYPVRHEDFTTYGAMERFVPGISGRARQNPQLAFETAALYSLNFFNAHVRREDKAIKFLTNDLRENNIPPGFQDGVSTDWRGIRRLAALKTIDEHGLNRLYKEGGFARVQEIYKELTREDPKPFSKSTYFNFGRFLSEPEEKEFWYSAYLKSYPESSEAHYLLGEVKQKLGRKEEAVRLYEKTLEIFDRTDHIILEKIFRGVIERRLKVLRG